MNLFGLLVKEIEKAIKEHPKKILELQVLEDNIEGKMIYIPKFFRDLPFSEFIIPNIAFAIKEEKDKFFVIDPEELVNTLSQRKRGGIFVGLVHEKGMHYSSEIFVDYVLFEKPLTGEPYEEIETTLDLSLAISFEDIPIEDIGEEEIEHSLREFLNRANKIKDIKISNLEEENDKGLEEFPSFFDSKKTLTFSGQNVRGSLEISYSEYMKVYSSYTRITNDNITLSTKFVFQDDKAFLDIKIFTDDAGEVRFTNISRLIF